MIHLNLEEWGPLDEAIIALKALARFNYCKTIIAALGGVPQYKIDPWGRVERL